MSSGELPLEAYHATSEVGSGSYGTIVTVYDDEGEEFCMKKFDDDDEEEEEEEGGSNYGLSLGTLREISILRLLRSENSHPNIIEIHDLQEDDEVNAMVMPLYKQGSLCDSFSRIKSKRQKAVIAFELLNAVAYLHENSFIHRDIKSDNILLTCNDNGEDDEFHAVLIDFSLAKLINTQNDHNETTHTPSVGTPTYRAPEVVNEEPYGLPSDLWSVGVVLLELLQGKCIESFRDRGAMAYISEQLDKLPMGQPFPSLLRGLLEPDPSRRWTAREALNCDLFAKFELSADDQPRTFHRINFSNALPIDRDENEKLFFAFDDKENNGNSKQKRNPSSSGGTKKGSVSSKLLKRSKFIRKICDWMEWTTNPITFHAAILYSTQMNELCNDIDDLKESNTLLDCIVLAHKFFEYEMSSRDSLNDLYVKFGGQDAEFDADEYSANENALFTMMDFCLYCR